MFEHANEHRRHAEHDRTAFFFEETQHEFGVEAMGQYLGAPCLKGPERSQTASGGMKHWHRIDPRIVRACPDRQSVDPTVVSQVPMR